MIPRAWIKSLVFSDGSNISLNNDDVVVIVGPNNSGKSAALRAIRLMTEDPAQLTPVISELELMKSGSADDLIAWLDETAGDTTATENPTYQFFGASVRRDNIPNLWSQKRLPNLSRYFCHLLTASERLIAASPAKAIAITTQSPTHAIHYLQRDDSIETRLSKQFHRAFGADLIVHRNAGSEVPLYVGKRPVPAPGQDRVSRDYVLQLEKLPELKNQGDGMRSFAGVLLEASVGRESILLVDEPEAFLHPPQARQLGRMLVEEKSSDRQLFLATHSGDFLRGVLDSNSKCITVVRISRAGDANAIRRLDNNEVQTLWSDPLLRYSNVLDGLFHESVIVTESDSDARFYSAIMDALFSSDDSGNARPDTMFTNGGGKSRLPLIVSALRRVGVPVRKRSMAAGFSRRRL